MRWMLALLIVMLGGCSVVKVTPAPAEVHLQPESVAVDETTGMCGDRTLQLAALDAPLPLHTVDIVYDDTKATVYRYMKTRWETPPVHQWERHVTAMLVRRGIFKAVVSDDSLAKSDWIAEWRLANMTQTIAEDKSAQTRLTFFVSVLDRSSRSVVAQRLFDETQTQREGSLQTALASWNAMGGRFEAELVDWFEQLCERYPVHERSDGGL